MTRHFSKSIHSLDAIYGFLAEFLREESLPESGRYDLELILEELFSNFVKYNTTSTNDVEIQLEREQRGVVLRLSDFDVEPFDVTQNRKQAASERVSNLTPGGLGLHLVQRMADRLEYSYENRTSLITVYKQLA